ncbi:MAG: hypothetical protein IME99_05615 [Proteobacteria bacterium]|nr:hypothetical protein [Pseudomonadota bacterium]
MTDHNEHDHEEDFVDLNVTLEADQVEMLKELAAEYKEQLNQAWDLSAVLRVAVGDFLTKLGRIA